mmetsp:Transcript_14372/g.23720  ORF Transcript_14372/g.23720 Transcript_14372/m.23720 type:complete len:220 (+) Transcript_14372:77-736(+)|eukprot:CAMPEP_0119011572 /NCGR_PEP_ID=MMETSP1176-20130426/5762_1 /TAXON_ID=265551 /ORGANISM="Synedropsis recta cf, Strain CCMP1620" /LENGTH=219 /DNA_ID=CAMNT_0006964421 /DNA_START=54 /DNA_END=713 /DNA_ORIENTATION=+
MTTRLLILLTLHVLTGPLVTGLSASSYLPPQKGLEVRVCQDRDCLTDGGKEALSMIQELSQGSQAKVTTCGCIGPCGNGPNVNVLQDGIRVKDSRPGQSNYYVFRNINSAESAAAMLEAAGVAVPERKVQSVASKVGGEIESTREFWDFDRTTRIALQRLIYAATLLPLVDASQQGTWDQINGVVVPNSYYAFGAAVFVASQFMGTSSQANAVTDDSED